MNDNNIIGTIKNKGLISGSIHPKSSLKGSITTSSDLSGNIMYTMLKGLSAYEVAVMMDGYDGTVEEWLESLIGNGIESAVMNNDYTLTLNFTDGTNFTTSSLRGTDGYSPYIGGNGDWFVWDEERHTYIDTGINVNSSNDYEIQINKPQIESVELLGNKTFSDLGLSPIGADDLLEILN